MNKINKPCGVILFIAITLVFVACEKRYSGGGAGYSYQGGGIYNYNSGIGNTDSITENPFIKTIDSATSTFSIDADGGSYAMARKLFSTSQSNINSYKDALRTEELINYFTYNYPDATNGEDIGVNGEVSSCPWNSANKLIRIGIKGKSVTPNNYPYANFVLLIDVSGSMGYPDKLQLLKDGFTLFAQ